MTVEEDELEIALRTARSLIDIGHSPDDVWQNPLIPEALREAVKKDIESDRAFTLVPPIVITKSKGENDWLRDIDRSDWYYWPELRHFLLTKKGFQSSVVRSIDDSSDRILNQIAYPEETEFDTRGLVLGYVQSGKTANYTALIAKAVDAGYRLVIVLSGIDNGLRRQTNIRLKKELVGSAGGDDEYVPLPPTGRRWHEFTSDDLNGDFDPGHASHAALQGQHPVLLVIKKNADVLRRLLEWLGKAPGDVLENLPVLVIDDEADQASIDTRGDSCSESEEDYEPPSVINGLIRDLLQRFSKRTYVAYTATPFANVLIPHDSVDPEVGSDLYPKDFIIDLPKPKDYFGAEEFFGQMDAEHQDNSVNAGLDVIRNVDDADLLKLESGKIPYSLRTALLDFILAGSARQFRKKSKFAATMLIHTSRLTEDQGVLTEQVQALFSDIRDAWRYQRKLGIRDELEKHWNSDFRRTTKRMHIERDCEFLEIEDQIGPFIESIKVKEVNSVKGDILDYEREPWLRAIAVGGNRLSRGLTLEGLTTSYFIRRSPTYDTLMQMGRWFGFRQGYEDLTRIYMTSELKQWFADLSFVEMQLREDIGVYEEKGITPLELGMRIKEHPSMQVTSPLKRRFTRTTMLSQSYSGAFQQTFKFPFSNPELFSKTVKNNKSLITELMIKLSEEKVGEASTIDDNTWLNVPRAEILELLSKFSVGDVGGFSPELISAYIRKVARNDELKNWTVSVRGRQKFHSSLGKVDIGLPQPVNQVSRTRIINTNSLGVIRNPDDELLGFSELEVALAKQKVDEQKARGKKLSFNSAAREIRPPSSGLFLIYPISRFSGHEQEMQSKSREPLFSVPGSESAIDLIGVAISFPYSKVEHQVQAYLEGSLGWRAAE